MKENSIREPLMLAGKAIVFGVFIGLIALCSYEASAQNIPYIELGLDTENSSKDSQWCGQKGGLSNNMSYSYWVQAGWAQYGVTDWFVEMGQNRCLFNNKKEKDTYFKLGVKARFEF